MSGPQQFTNIGNPVEEVASWCRRGSAESFSGCHGEHFLLQRGEVEQDEREAWARFSTISIEREQVESAVGAPQGDHLVYRVPTEGKAPFPSWITVGRTKTNMIVVDHGSVSKLHGFFLPEGRGAFSVYDAKSLNGTAVNAALAPLFGKGEKLPVVSGDRVRFGQAAFLFLDYSALWTLLT